MKKKGILAAVLLVLLLLVGCSLDASRLTASLFTVSVPDLVGLSLEEAEAKCANAGFETETVFVEADAPADTVISTDPAANTKAKSSSVVKLFCSRGKAAAVRIPNVAGKSLEDAKNSLRLQGLQIGNMTYENSDKAKDTVILTDPLPGCEVPEGSAVDLTLSSGSQRESKLYVVVKLPTDVSTGITLEAYVDGRLDQTKAVNPSLISQTSFAIKGTSGKKTVDVHMQGVLYKSYELDFDEKLVTEQ